MMRAHAERNADSVADRALASRRDQRRAEAEPAVRAAGHLEGGRPLESAAHAEMRSAFGWNFGAVRVHDDARAARLTEGASAHAATLGTHIAFAPGRYRPESAEGRRLLAHELAHVLQQQQTGPTLQLQGDGTHVLDSVLTMNWDVHFKQNHPTAAELSADASVVLTPAGVRDLDLVTKLLANDPLAQAQLEGNASIEGPLAENVRLSARRARWLGNRIGQFRVADAPGHVPECPVVVPGEYACGIANAAATVNPDDRKVTIRIYHPREAGAPAPNTTVTPKPPPTDTTTGKTPDTGKTGDAGKTDDTGKTPDTGKTGDTGKTPDAGSTETPPTSGNQLGAQAGIGPVRHYYYKTPAGPNDPLREWVSQFTASYTHQFHGKDKSGAELQFPVTAQYSLTTKQWTILAGEQGSYVFQLPANLQLSFFEQLMGGKNVTAGAKQFQPAVGAQLLWQPADWFSLGVQGSGSYTFQKGSPPTRDLGGLFFIQVQW